MKNSSDERRLTSNSRYIFGELLGQGCAGRVYEALRVADEKRFALKRCYGRDIEDGAIKQAFREAALMKHIAIPGREHSGMSFP